MPEEKSTSPIFIVGSSRSGSSLLAAMLSANSRIACGPETQILNKIKPPQIAELLADTEWPKLAIKHLSQMTLADQRVIDIYNLTEDQLKSDLAIRPQSIASLFEAIAGNFALRHGKPRWVEKTPRHLLHLHTIRKEFPDAKIIRIVRDPRDSALSMRQLNWTSNHYLPNLYIWNEWYNQTDSFFTTDKNSTTIRYEDLAHSAEEVLVSLCRFINEDFEAGMLQTHQSGKLVSTKNEVWKKQVSENLDTSRCYRWKQELSKTENTASEYLVSKWLIKFGYENNHKKAHPLATYELNTKLVEQYQDSIITLASHGYTMTATTTPMTEKNLHIFIKRGQSSGEIRPKNIFKLQFERLKKLKRTTLLVSEGTTLKLKERFILTLLATRIKNLPLNEE